MALPFPQKLLDLKGVHGSFFLRAELEEFCTMDNLARIMAGLDKAIVAVQNNFTPTLRFSQKPDALISEGWLEIYAKDELVNSLKLINTRHDMTKVETLALASDTWQGIRKTKMETPSAERVLEIATLARPAMSLVKWQAVENHVLSLDSVSTPRGERFRFEIEFAEEAMIIRTIHFDYVFCCFSVPMH